MKQSFGTSLVIIAWSLVHRALSECIAGLVIALIVGAVVGFVTWFFGSAESLSYARGIGGVVGALYVVVVLGRYLATIFTASYDAWSKWKADELEKQLEDEA